MKNGDWVTLTRSPDALAALPAEDQRAIRFCVGRTFRVAAVDGGNVVIDVGRDLENRFEDPPATLVVPADHVRAVPRITKSFA